MPIRQKFLLFLLFAVIFLFFPKEVLAKIEIVNYPLKIEIGQEFKIVVSLSGLTSQYHSLSIVFQKQTSDPYFGQTKKGSDWIEAEISNCQNFPQFEVISGSWNGELTGRIVWDEEDFDNTLGNYILKIAKYTIPSCSESFSDGKTIELYTNDLPTATPTSEPIPTPTAFLPTPTPLATATPTPKATYKINEVKDENGGVISSAWIYIDDAYTHHYAPETLTFCSGCHCDNDKNVDCEFGEHTVRLERSGYQDWEETKTINPGGVYEINPVMETQEEAPTATPTPTNTPTPTPTLKSLTPTPKPTLKPTATATGSGEILGQESSPAAFYPWEATEEAKSASQSSPSSSNRLLPAVLLVAGFILLFSAAFWLWYTQLRNEN